MNFNKDICTLEVVNWDKYHPRKDYKSIPWIRVDCDIFDDPIWARLPRFSALVWIYLLTVCGRLNTNRASFQLRLASFALHLKPVIIRQIIDGLEELQKVRVIERTWPPKSTNVARSLRNDTIRNDTKRNIRESTGVDAPPLKLVDLWNANADKCLPRVKAINPKRKRKARACWKVNPTEAYWLGVIEKINESDFCLGKNNRGWMANFDWFLQDGVADKLIEGVYAGNGGASATQLDDKFFSFLPEGN